MVKAAGMTRISKSQVSRLFEEIDSKVTLFLEPPVEGVENESHPSQPLPHSTASLLFSTR